MASVTIYFCLIMFIRSSLSGKFILYLLWYFYGILKYHKINRTAYFHVHTHKGLHDIVMYFHPGESVRPNGGCMWKKTHF